MFPNNNNDNNDIFDRNDPNSFNPNSMNNFNPNLNLGQNNFAYNLNNPVSSGMNPLNPIFTNSFNNPNSMNNFNPNMNFGQSNFAYNLNNPLSNEMNSLNANFNNIPNNNSYGNYDLQSNSNYIPNPNINNSQNDMNYNLSGGRFDMNQLGMGVLNRADPQMFNLGLTGNNAPINNFGLGGLNNNLSYDARRTVNLTQLGLDNNGYNNLMNNINNLNINPDRNEAAPMFYNTMRNDGNFMSRFMDIQGNMQNINTQNEEEMRLRQEEEMQRLLEDEAEIQKMKDQMKNFFKINKNITYIKQDLFAIRRSEYFNERDRFFFEELLQLPLKTNGILGMGNIMLDKSALFAEKSRENFGIQYNKENDYFVKLSRDGVYLDYIKKKVYSYNIQKLEQRLLREGKFDWFKSNGDLKLETDIFEELLTRPIDISLTTNDKFNLHTLSPQLCLRSTDRLVKKYQLKLYISKIIFMNHPIFNLEDKLCSELKELYNNYYLEMNKLQLPYLKEKINIMNRRLDEFRKEKEQTEAQKQEIKNMKILVQEAIDFLNESKKNINLKANVLYNKWIEIKNLRIAQKYSSTNLRLNVIKFPSSNRENPNVFDYAFVLTAQEPTMDKLFLPNLENKRRDNVKKIQAYAKIFINNIYLAKTKPIYLNWPDYSFDIDSLFNLTVNTRPTKIHLELYIKNGWFFKKTCKIEINPPGIYMNTVTSSSSLHEEMIFDNSSQILGDYFKSNSDILTYNNKEGINYQRINSNINLNNELNSPNANNIEESGKLLAEENKQNLQKDLYKAEESKEYIRGKILYKSEWKGQAPDMPPTKIEDRVILYEKRHNQNSILPAHLADMDKLVIKSNIPKEQQNQKDKNAVSDTKNLNSNKEIPNSQFVVPDYPYDINDPRNVLIFEKIKKFKTELLLKYLYKEYMLPFFDVDSIRQIILQKRLEKNSLKQIKIPLLEKQIENDTQLQKMMRNLLKEKENLSKEELDKKIKIQLELLNRNHSGMILSDEEFYAFVNEKIKTLRKDVVNKVQYSYFQIISEFYYATDIFKILNNLIIDICEQDRKLRPKRKKKDDKKVEKCSSIKINVHVVKGYNIPIRKESKPNSYIEKRRDEMVDKLYHKVVGSRNRTRLNFNPINWFWKGNANINANKSLSMNSVKQAGFNNFMNPNIGMGMGMNMPMNPSFPNPMNPMLSPNNIMPGLLTNNNLGPNNFNNLNNSQLFNNAGTMNNSFNDVNINLGGIPNINPNNLNIFNNMINNSAGNRFNLQGQQNDFNNLNVPFPLRNNNMNMNPIMPNQSGPLNNSNLNVNPTQMFNPNLNNVMGNPNMPGMMPSYNLPNMYMGNEAQRDDFVYDGDIIRMVEQLRYMERNVKSFVEVKLVYYDQKYSIRTDSIDGVHPDYNYKMQFEIIPKDEAEFFTKEEFHKSNGGLYFTLYDEVRTEDVIQEKDANTYIYKYEKKYLGSLFLPFTTIFQNASLLETVSKINVPMTVFSYYSDTSTAFDVQSKKEEDLRRQSNFALMNANNNPNFNASQNSFFTYFKDGQLKIINPSINTYLSLYITLDPIMNVFKAEDIDYVPGFEDSTFLINTTKWLKTLKEDFLLKSRYIKLFGENFDGYSVFIPRFLKPQKPPEIVFDLINNPNDELSIEKAARYVSLIPFVEDSQAFEEDISDCWCTDDQFLSLGFGDYEEHAILLCNYFNYIDKAQNKNVTSYLCLGKAYPEGNTLYVIRICNSSPDVELWNARTGECYYFDKRYKTTTFLGFSVIKSFANSKAMGVDDMCQMKEIGCIISDSNVYVNIQEHIDPGLIAFDLKDETCWKPFLNDKSRRKYFPQGIKTIQIDLEYEYPTSEESYLLKEKILNHLKKEIDITRACQTVKGKPLRTRWDSAATDTIETLLSDYDGIYMTTKKSAINFNLAGQDILVQKKNIEDEVLNKLYNIQTQIQNCIVGVKEIYGFPINESFTSIKNIWEQVKLTDIHMTVDEENELNLSVHVNGYPNKIFSVWIFFSVFKK